MLFLCGEETPDIGSDQAGFSRFALGNLEKTSREVTTTLQTRGRVGDKPRYSSRSGRICKVCPWKSRQEQSVGEVRNPLQTISRVGDKPRYSSRSGRIFKIRSWKSREE